jgi:hypothetical protein
MTKVEQLHGNGKINDYMFGVLQRSKDAMDLSLWTEAVQDAIEATEAGVTNDRDFQIFHYIDTFVEDIVDEIFGQNLDQEEEAELKIFMFKLKDKIDYSNLLAFWAAILKWLESRNSFDKQAYPNRGNNGLQYIKSNNIITWAKLATTVRRMLVGGVTEKEAVSTAAQSLHPRERLDFIAWYRFKFGKLNKLYNVNNIIKDLGEGTMSYKKPKTKFASIYESEGRYFIPEFNRPYLALDEEQKEPEQSPEDLIDKEMHRENFQEARSKLVSRTFAIDKLLERYHDLIGDKALDEIEDALNMLRKRIRALKCASTVRDSVIKTANIVRKNGFSAGANYLEIFAYDFTGEEITKTAFNGINLSEINPILSELQLLSNQLKRRDIVREIAKLDFKLHDMNASALFPELAEAQAKLIDATTYASNKLEDVIPKLRSVTQRGTFEEPSREPVAPASPKGVETVPKATPPKPEAPKAAPAPAPKPAPAAPGPATPAPPPAVENKGLTEFEKAI